MKQSSLGFLFLALSVLSSCDSTSDSSATGNLDLVLKSSDLARGSRAGTSCSVSYESSTVLGKCYTPLSVKGVFSTASLGSTSGGAGVRVLGGGTETGLESIFKQAAFDLETSPTISGDDNIQDGSGGPFNLVSLSVQALEVAFVAESGAKVYRVRVPFVSTPPSSNASFFACLDTPADVVDPLGTIWSGITASPGDILVCIKNTETETCAASDYKWVDGSGVLQTTRPGSPKRLSGTYLATAESCTTAGDHPDITWGNASLDIGLSQAVAISAAFGEGGAKTYTTDSGSGSKLTINLDIDTTESLFVPDAAFTSDLSATLQAAILSNIEKILLKSIYINNNKTTAATASGARLNAVATLTVE